LSFKFEFLHLIKERLSNVGLALTNKPLKNHEIKKLRISNCVSQNECFVRVILNVVQTKSK